MDKTEILYNDYCKIKHNYLENRSINLKEDLKNKLIELDYEITKEYEEKLNTDFPMTTTLEKEEKRLESLIEFIKGKIDRKKELINDYKKITGQTIELSYLKNSERLQEYKTRLELVKKFLNIKKDITKLLNNPKEFNNQKIKVLKNKLLKTEMLNLLYEFCLIDSLDAKDIEIEKLVQNKDKIIKKEEINEENKQPVINNIEKNVEIRKPKPTEENKPLSQPVIKQENNNNNILTSMPKLDKLGTVNPVNVFESIKKTEEKLPDVVIPSNGLTNENTEIFLDTKDYFK